MDPRFSSISYEKEEQFVSRHSAADYVLRASTVFLHQTLSFDCVCDNREVDRINSVKWTKLELSTSRKKTLKTSSTTGDCAFLLETQSLADARTGKHTQYDRYLSKR